MAGDDGFSFAPRRAIAYEAVLVGLWVAPLVVVAFAFAGLERLGVLVLAVLLLAGLSIRASRLALIIGRDHLVIRNYLRTYRFPWSDVRAIGTGAILIRPALGFVLRDGTVRCAQVTQDSRRLRDDVRERLRRYAPASVEFLQDARETLKTGRCPRCGETKLAPDLDGSGTRYCWGCRAEVPDRQAAAPE